MSSSICLSQLPEDILLHILSFSELLDNVSFAMVCKKTYSLSTQRSFWIYALQNERTIRPIACTHHESLTGHDLRRLRQIALHTLRLQRNWASESPRILHPIAFVSLGLGTVTSFYQIPGTGLHVFYVSSKNALILWHVGQKTPVGGPIEVPTDVVEMTACANGSGQFLVACLGSDSNDDSQHRVAVVCVEYGGQDTEFKLILNRKLAKGIKHWCIFLVDDLVGTLCTHDDKYRGLTVCMFVFNMFTMKEVFITTDLPSSLSSQPMIDATFTPTIDGQVYILITNNLESRAFAIPNSQFPHANDEHPSPPISTEILEVEFASFEVYSHSARDLDPGLGSRTYASKSNAHFGVPLLTVVTSSSMSQSEFLDVHFWVRTNNPKEPIKLLSLPTVIPGFLELEQWQFWYFSRLAFSGRKALLTHKVRDAENRVSWVLGLLSCDPDASGADSEKVSYRKLTLPKSFDLSTFSAFSLDDHMGVVTLLDKRGVLYTISYA